MPIMSASEFVAEGFIDLGTRPSKRQMWERMRDEDDRADELAFGKVLGEGRDLAEEWLAQHAAEL
jgi:hypothetical protein